MPLAPSGLVQWQQLQKEGAYGESWRGWVVQARELRGEGTPLHDGEVHGLVFSLLGAGLVPPAQALSLATLRLLLDPAAADTLRRDPDRLPAAVDELLRLDPGGAGSTDRMLRAVADLELAGVHIAAGELVILPLGAANRDPAE